MTYFVDSSFLIALYNKDDEFHEEARTTALNLEKKNSLFITSNIALAEAINVVFRTKGAKIVFSFYSVVLEAKIKIFSINDEIFQKGLKTLFLQKTKSGLNFFDCLHLASLKYLGVKTILTFDMDFKNFNHLP